MNKTSFFRRSDWIALGFTFLISLIVYTLTLQPTVGLEDSGELIVASDYLGVPHPPGYPIWSLLTWAFQWIFHKVTYHGYPNPAWAVNFFSAFTGAAACGILAMLVSRSGMDFLRNLKKETAVLGEKTESLFCCVAGIASGLLLAFSQGMWSQSVIAEVYAPNILFQTAVLLFLYRWMSEPDNPKPLFIAAFIFGLGLTNHQTLLFMGLAIGLGVFLKSFNKPVRELISFVISLGFGVVGVVLLALSNIFIEESVSALKMLGAIVCFVGSGAVIYFELKRTSALLAGSLVFLLLSGCGVAFGVMGVLIAGVVGSLACCLFIKEKSLVRDFFIVAVMFVLMFGLNKVGPEEWAWNRGWDYASFWFWSAYAVLIPVLGLFLPNGKTVCATYLLMLLGLSFYLYMPFSSDQNPPINWGYPRTWEGLMHAITRGQYEQVKLAHVFSFRFLLQVGAYLRDLRAQFLAPVAVLAAIPFIAMRWLGKKNNFWLLTTLTAFIGVGLLFMILQNPKIDMQTLFIARVQYIQSHAVYAIWLGYGLLLMMAWLETLAHDNILTKWIGVTLVCLLPFSLVWKNYYSKQQEHVVGGSEQNGHDFGWQFGNWQLQGVEGIKEDLWYYCDQDQEKFDEEWANYPNPDYPPPMGTNAIFFGGTDPGRFVPTYMIYCPQVRADVYLITQNALADNTYMAVMRDLYGDQIWIPAQKDSNVAFREYVEGVQSGRINAGADVSTEDGRVQVQGVGGVMKINGILCRQIFDHNQYITEAKTDESTRQSGAAVVPLDPIGPKGKLRQREFYIEESYVIPWMFPYLTPHGLIMKINNHPTPITPEMIKNDREFWTWYVDRLVSDRKFVRDVVARKTFSKLRSAIAGLYTARGYVSEAEYALKQAAALYPLSGEVTFRLADLYLRQQRPSEARALIKAFAEKDAYNDQVIPTLRYIDQMEAMIQRKAELEALMMPKEGEPVNVRHALELVQIYNAMQMHAEMRALAGQILSANLPPQILLELAQQFTQMRRFDLTEKTLVKYVAENPEDVRAWTELAAIRVTRNQITPALDAIEKAVELGGDSVRSMLIKDARFNPLRKDARFQKLVPPMTPKKSIPFNKIF